jgi:hypothetical protein
MPGTFAAAVLPIAVVALVSPGKAFAGPPKEVPGRMVFDEVVEGLRRFRKENDPQKQLAWMKRLAPTGDPRVGVALFDWVATAGFDQVGMAAGDLLERYYSPPKREKRPPLGGIGSPLSLEPSRAYANPDMIVSENHFERWARAEADLRRRAKKLPQ